MNVRNYLRSLALTALLVALPSSAAPPGISQQPIGQTVLAGSSVNLRVNATNGEPLFYQWFRGPLNLPSETNATLTVSNATLTHGGDYVVLVTSSFGRTTSSIAPVTVVGYLPNAAITAAVGARVSLSVMKNGRPVKAQWFKNGESLTPNYTLSANYFESSFILPNVDSSNAGQYSAVVSNDWGVVHPPCTELSVVPSGPLDARHSISRLPAGEYLNLEQHNNLFFASGEYQIAISSNALAWNVTSNFPNLFYDVVWGGGTYVAVGENSRLYTSFDGASWTPQTITAFGALRSVACGAGTFVVAAQQEIFASHDGTNWLKAAPAIADLFQDVVWGGGRFVLISVNGRIQTSTNGFDWEPSVVEPLGYLYSVAYGNGRFVAGGSDGLTMTSLDGVRWQAHGSGTLEWLTKVAYGCGIFLGITRSSTLLSSSDGVSWIIRARGTNELIAPFNYNGLICAANGTFLLGATNKVLLQTDPFAMVQVSVTPTPWLSLYGPTGRPYRIEALDSSSHEQWYLLDTVIPAEVPFNWVDPEPSAQYRLYRVVSP